MMEILDWEVKGINYWENPKCPRNYLEEALLQLIEDVEGEILPKNYFKHHSDFDVRNEVGRYEHVSGK